ncbi:sulfite exporter TauE/SafE family protein [Marinobacterium jannaschii]|uniref:sulfite exporter TauE/SafE family protein n=1 Tax=Marinobacterium jannaschii TaxID=64970 RepID=UPI0004891B35|nr:sulfite exporter TauE/SafE family protein [Marinobacterium jannaschii]
MELTLLISFLVIMALGAYVQTVTGFALGMIVMGGVTAFDLAPVLFTSVIISLMALANGLQALKGNWKELNREAVKFAFIGLVPALALGVWLLTWMSSELNQMLKILLGVTIIAGGLFIMLKPEPLKQPSGPLAFATAGAAGGFLAGMFSIAGPPLVFQFYRQPYSMKCIRLCLLAIFLCSSSFRTLMVGLQGELNLDMFIYAGICLPVVSAATWLGKKYPPPLSDKTMRRLAFTLLIIIGGTLLVKELL